MSKTDAGGVSEARAFKDWLETWLMPSEFSPIYLYKVDEDGHYTIDFVRNCWDAWQASAALRSTPNRPHGPCGTFRSIRIERRSERQFTCP